MLDWMTVLQQIAPNAYVVGGAVRDRLLGRAITDYDITVDGDVTVLGKRLAEAIDARYLELDRQQRSVRLVLNENSYLDLSSLQGKSIEEDCMRRDFTINAMAVPLERWTVSDVTPHVIDPAGGTGDCRKGLIRMVAKENLLSDPLRAWRAVRLAGELRFALEPDTRAALRDTAAQVRQIPGERLGDEVRRILSLPHAVPWVNVLLEAGLLSALWPELDKMRGVEQNRYHEFTVWEHSWRAFDCFESIINQLDYIDESNTKARLRDYLDSAPNTWLFKLGALIHDIGKPQTQSVSDDGRVRFHGHELVGAKIAAAMGKRIRLSRRENCQLQLFVRYHMYPLQLLRTGRDLRDYEYRFFKRTKPVGVWVLLFSLADHLAKGEAVENRSEFQRHRTMVEQYVHDYFFARERVEVRPLLSGGELMSELGLKPGPLIGQLLDYVLEKQARGTINTRTEALAAARQWLKRRQSTNNNC